MFNISLFFGVKRGRYDHLAGEHSNKINHPLELFFHLAKNNILKLDSVLKVNKPTKKIIAWDLFQWLFNVFLTGALPPKKNTCIENSVWRGANFSHV